MEPKQRWSKYQSYDAQEDQDERRRMLADIQVNELEANYQFDSELPKIIQAVLSENEEKKWSFGREWAKIWSCL